jgi:uncharacterized heparinase superfamily protein
VDARPAPRTRDLDRDGWKAPAAHQSSMVGPACFHLLGEVVDLAESGWDDPAMDKLLRYNLHYFADLTSSDAAAHVDWHRALLSRWVQENAPGRGTGWDSYPTSLRIVNWVKWTLAGHALPAECVHSLAVQTRWLARRLERHLLGNHLFANAKALLFAGAFFDGREASGWIALGASILDKELPEQILPDGGHFERSTMYHALALEDVLDLCNIAATMRRSPDQHLSRVADGCRARAGEMLRWLSVMSHPDGEIAFFNDAAFDIAPSPAVLARYAERLALPAVPAVPMGLTTLEPSGYARATNASAAVLMDVAPLGPDYLPGHAHADTLSFELSLFTHRVLVNSGTSLYGLSEERLRQRGSAAHNTVVLDDVDSSEVWSGFRVGHRARPVGIRVGSGAATELEAAHDGYRRLAGAPIHRRRWTLEEGVLTITDVISGSFRRAESRIHLHPSVAVESHQPGGESDCLVLRLTDGRPVTLQVDGGTLHVEPATWHPRFGESITTHCIVTRFRGAALRTRLEWSAAS